MDIIERNNHHNFWTTEEKLDVLRKWKSNSTEVLQYRERITYRVKTQFSVMEHSWMAGRWVSCVLHKAKKEDEEAKHICQQLRDILGDPLLQVKNPGQAMRIKRKKDAEAQAEAAITLTSLQTSETTPTSEGLPARPEQGQKKPRPEQGVQQRRVKKGTWHENYAYQILKKLFLDGVVDLLSLKSFYCSLLNHCRRIDPTSSTLLEMQIIQCYKDLLKDLSPNAEHAKSIDILLFCYIQQKACDFGLDANLDDARILKETIETGRERVYKEESVVD